MSNYKKDKSYIKQRLEYVNSVDYISELEEQIENLQIENNHLSKSYGDAILFNQKRCEQNKELKQRINKAIKELKKYENDKEANYYAPIQDVLDILEGIDEE